MRIGDTEFTAAALCCRDWCWAIAVLDPSFRIVGRIAHARHEPIGGLYYDPFVPALLVIDYATDFRSVMRDYRQEPSTAGQLRPDAWTLHNSTCIIEGCWRYFHVACTESTRFVAAQAWLSNATGGFSKLLKDDRAEAALVDVTSSWVPKNISTLCVVPGRGLVIFFGVYGNMGMIEVPDVKNAKSAQTITFRRNPKSPLWAGMITNATPFADGVHVALHFVGGFSSIMSVPEAREVSNVVHRSAYEVPILSSNDELISFAGATLSFETHRAVHRL